MLVKFVVLGDVRIGFPAAYPRQSKSQSAFQSVSIQGREEGKYTAERGWQGGVGEGLGIRTRAGGREVLGVGGSVGGFFS